MRRRHHVTVLRSAVKLWYCLFCSNFWASFLSELLNPQKVSRDTRSGITIFPSTWWSLAVGLNPSAVTTSSPFQAVCNIYSSSALDFHSIQPSFSGVYQVLVSVIRSWAVHSTNLPWHGACEEIPRCEWSLTRTLVNTTDASASADHGSGSSFCPLLQWFCSAIIPTNTTLEQKQNI